MIRRHTEFSSFGEELRESMEQALAYARGKGPARVTRIEMPDPPPKLTKSEIVVIRRRRRLTQSQFARLLNVSSKTVQGWEQGVRRPSGPALRLLQFFLESGAARRAASRIIL